MAESYRVTLEKEYLIFSAAHFITFNGNVCERLHGHNYRVRASVDGALDENHYVIDFIALHDALKEITLQLDHHVLLPTEHPSIHVEAGEKEVEVRYEERRWVFPREDCVLLPLPNTTAELIARYIGHELLDRLARLVDAHPSRLQIGVDENEGQWAEWTWTPEPK